MESLLEEQAERSEQSELYEIISELRENPIDLNAVNFQDLESIPVLTPKMRREIIKYRQQHGRFQSMTELLSLPGMTTEVYELLRELAFVPSQPIPGAKKVQLHSRTRISDRLDRPLGFANGTYQNSSQKIYQRLRFNIGENAQGGLLLEKDSGESRLDDLSLFYLSMDVTPTLSLLIGNYHLEIGQGLVLWGPYGFRKSSNVVFPIKKRGRGIRGYSTVDENAAFWGGSAAFTSGPWQLLAFVSQAKLDANPVSDHEVTNFFTTGFHRTETEKNKKDRISESVFGGIVRYSTSIGLTAGVTYYASSFDKTVNNRDLARNRFNFRGDENSVLGFDWDWSARDLVFFGEVARSKNGGKALITGVQLDFEKVQMAFLYRNYQRDFHNFHGFGFADKNGSTQNERGYYTGLRYQVASHTLVSAYYDIFYHPWRTFFEPLPVTGRDFLAQLEQRFRSKIKATVRFRQKEGSQTEEFRDLLNREKREFVNTRKTQWRLQLEYAISSSLRLRNRIQYTRFRLTGLTQIDSERKEEGISMYQEIRYQPTRALQLLWRLTFFDTDSFDSRVFQYEHDLPGVITNRALFGRGNRWYFLLKVRLSKLAEFNLKYSESFRDDTDVIGTGPDQIDGNLDRRIGLQLEMRL